MVASIYQEGVFSRSGVSHVVSGPLVRFLADRLLFQVFFSRHHVTSYSFNRFATKCHVIGCYRWNIWSGNRVLKSHASADASTITVANSLEKYT